MADITQWVDFEKDCLIQEFQIAGESAQFFEYKGDFLPSVKKNSYIGTPKLDSSGVFRYYFHFFSNNVGVSGQKNKIPH